ncbi:unnamed protein product [Rhizophagus irregularis]|nr:unnamed protein product [Rhizophagus irregularis]
MRFQSWFLQTPLWSEQARENFDGQIFEYLTRQSTIDNWYSRYLDGILSLPKTSIYCIEPSRFDQSQTKLS